MIPPREDAIHLFTEDAEGTPIISSPKEIASNLADDADITDHRDGPQARGLQKVKVFPVQFNFFLAMITFHLFLEKVVPPLEIVEGGTEFQNCTNSYVAACATIRCHKLFSSIGTIQTINK